MSNKIEEGIFINNSYIYPIAIHTNDNVLERVALGEPYIDSDIRLSNALSNNIILPPNCRIVSTRDNGGYTFLLELPPAIRTIGISESLLSSEYNTFITEFGGTYEEIEKIMATKCLSQTENVYYKIRLQFPWTIFIITVDRGIDRGVDRGVDPGNDIYEINSMKVYFSKISISTPEDKIFIPPLTNINSDGRLCIPRTHASSSICDLVSDQVDLFWGSIFNRDLSGHKLAYPRTSNLYNLLKWSLESLKDPLFIFKEQFCRETSLVESGVFDGRRQDLPSTLYARIAHHRSNKYISSITTDDGKTYYRGDIITLNDKYYRIAYFLGDGRVELQEETDKSVRIEENIKIIHQEYITKNEIVKIEDPIEIDGKVLKTSQLIKINLNGNCALYIIEDIFFDNRIGLYKFKVSGLSKWIVLSEYILKNTVIINKIDVGDTIAVKSRIDRGIMHILIGKVTETDRLRVTLCGTETFHIDDTRIESIDKYDDIESLELESSIEEITPFKWLDTVYFPNGLALRYIISNDILCDISDLRYKKSTDKINIPSPFAYKDLETNKIITYSIGSFVVFPEINRKQFSAGEIIGFEHGSSNSTILLKTVDGDIHRIKFAYRLGDNSLKLNLGIANSMTSFKIDFNNTLSIGDKIRPKIANIPHMKKSEVLEIRAMVHTKNCPMEVYLSNGRCVELADLLKYFEIYSKDDAKFNLKKNQLKFKEHPVIPGDIAIFDNNLCHSIITKVYPKRYALENSDIRYNYNIMVKPVPTKILDISVEAVNPN